MRIIRQRFPDAVDGLMEVPETGRILGIIISSAFEDTEYRARQDDLWAPLHERWSEQDLSNVGPISALTPTEAEGVRDAG